MNIHSMILNLFQSIDISHLYIQDVVKKVENTETDARDRPKKKVMIVKTEQEEVSEPFTILLNNRGE